jgi:hypothetical protein
MSLQIILPDHHHVTMLKLIKLKSIFHQGRHYRIINIWAPQLDAKLANEWITIQIPLKSPYNFHYHTNDS